jgi:hypothetical protein
MAFKAIKNFLTGKKGPGNAYLPPDLSFLKDTSGFDYLRDPSKYDFLKNGGTTNPFADGLPSAGKRFTDYYTEPEDPSDAMFDDLLGQIRAPSAVDEVTRGMEGDLMAELLAGVDRDTESSVGSLKMDFADRGLSGPGMLSDIEAVGLGQARAEGGRNRGKIRSEFALKDLERLKEREEAERAAYGKRYEVGAARGSQGRDIAARGASADASMFNELLRLQAQLGEGKAGRDLQAATSYADILRGNDALFAELLNARDISRGTGQAGLYNAGADRNIAGRKTGVLDRTNLDFSFGFGGK